MRILSIAALVLGLTAPAAAQTSIDGAASATLAPGASPMLNSTSRTYDLRSLYVNEGQTRWFVIETQTIREDPLEEMDGAVNPGHSTVSLREVLAGREIGPVITTVKTAANDLRVDRMPLLEVENWGCCVQANTLRSYDLLTGRLVSVRSSDLTIPTFTSLGQEAVGWRVEVFRALDPVAEEILGSDPAVFGLVTLIREDVPVQQLLLRFRSEKDGDASTPVDWLNQIGWSEAGKEELTDHFVLEPGQASAMSLVWTMDDQTRIAIPFTGERLDAGKATLPAGIVATERKVE